MGTHSVSTDYWRDYFGNAKSDIFEIIKHSILVAATDYPNEFRSKRGQVAEILFSCPTPFSCCDKTEMKDSNNVFRQYKGPVDDQVLIETEEENHVLAEILRIKQILDDFAYETSPVLFQSLRKLELMTLITLRILEESGIGVSVSMLQKHDSPDVRNLARRLIDSWRRMVDECVIATDQSSSLTAAVDDDSMHDSTICRISKAEPGQEKTSDGKEVASQVKKQQVTVKPIMQMDNHEVKCPQKPDKVLIKNATLTTPQCKSNCVDEVKLEAAKRKLQQNYKRIENAKRQRTIQVIEINDLPKQGRAQKKLASVKYSLQSRNRMNGRH